MICSRKIRLTISLLASLCIFVLPAFAGEIIEDFDSGDLSPALWEVRAVGGASFEIKDSQLIMQSPETTDGILLAYVPDIGGEDITFEFQFDISQGGDVSAQAWFAEVPVTPDVNTEVNSHWQLVQTIMSATTYAKISDGTKVIPDTPIDAGSNIYVFELVGDKVTFSINGTAVATIDKPENLNYFHIGPDMYTSHYGGRLGVLEYVKVSGPSVVPVASAVRSEGKLATTWAGLKS